MASKACVIGDYVSLSFKYPTIAGIDRNGYWIDLEDHPTDTLCKVIQINNRYTIKQYKLKLLGFPEGTPEDLFKRQQFLGVYGSRVFYRDSFSLVRPWRKVYYKRCLFLEKHQREITISNKIRQLEEKFLNRKRLDEIRSWPNSPS